LYDHANFDAFFAGEAGLVFDRAAAHHGNDEFGLGSLCAKRRNPDGHHE